MFKVKTMKRNIRCPAKNALMLASVFKRFSQVDQLDNRSQRI